MVWSVCNELFSANIGLQSILRWAVEHILYEPGGMMLSNYLDTPVLSHKCWLIWDGLKSTVRRSHDIGLYKSSLRLFLRENNDLEDVFLTDIVQCFEYISMHKVHVPRIPQNGELIGGASSYVFDIVYFVPWFYVVYSMAFPNIYNASLPSHNISSSLVANCSSNLKHAHKALTSINGKVVWKWPLAPYQYSWTWGCPLEQNISERIQW